MRLSSLLRAITAVIDDLNGTNLVINNTFCAWKNRSSTPKALQGGGRGGGICSWPWFLQSHEAEPCQQVLDHADIDAIGRPVPSLVLNQSSLVVMSQTSASVTDDLVQVWEEIPRKPWTDPSGADILGSACRGQPCYWAVLRRSQIILPSPLSPEILRHILKLILNSFNSYIMLFSRISSGMFDSLRSGIIEMFSLALEQRIWNKTVEITDYNTTVFKNLSLVQIRSTHTDTLCT